MREKERERGGGGGRERGLTSEKQQLRMYMRQMVWCSKVVNVFKISEPLAFSNARAVTDSQKSSCETRASCSPGLATQLILPSAVILCTHEWREGGGEGEQRRKREGRRRGREEEERNCYL